MSLAAGVPPVADLQNFDSQFRRGFAGPIDVESVFLTTVERTTYLNNNNRYSGQIVADLQTSKAYMLNAARDTWVELAGSSSGVQSIAQGVGVTVNNTNPAIPVISSTKTPIVNKTASHILELTDAGKMIEMDVVSDNTVTIPPNSTIAFPVETEILVTWLGVGQTSILAGVGVTLLSAGDLLSIGERYAAVALIKRAINTWYVQGNLA